MAISEAFSGTETVTTTRWSLTTDTSWSAADAQTSDGVFQFFIDLNALSKGDKYEFRIYEKVLAASTQRQVFEAIFSNAQSNPVWVSPTLIFMHGWDASLFKIAGTDRSIDWSIRQVA